MPGILAIIQLIVTLLPSIIQIIKQVEEALGPGNGQVKLAMVKDLLSVAYTSGKQFEEAWPQLQSVVNSTVKSFNAAGVFAAKKV